MRASILFAAVVAAAALPGLALAAHQRPGLWQLTSQMHFTKGGPQIPPELRARMQARGMHLPDFGAPHTFKHCVTPEQAAKQEHPDFGQDKDCRMVSGAWSGDSFHGEMVCNKSSGPSHGTFDATLGGDGTSMTMHSRVQGNAPQFGGDYEMDMHSEGHWLGPTCGKDAG